MFFSKLDHENFNLSTLHWRIASFVFPINIIASWFQSFNLPTLTQASNTSQDILIIFWFTWILAWNWKKSVMELCYNYLKCFTRKVEYNNDIHTFKWWQVQSRFAGRAPKSPAARDVTLQTNRPQQQQPTSQQRPISQQRPPRESLPENKVFLNWNLLKVYHSSSLWH